MIEDYENLIKNSMGKLKCVRGGSKENLMPYEYSKKITVKKTTHWVTTTHINATAIACLSCIEGFKKWEKVRDQNKGLYLCLCCISFVLTALFMGFLSVAFDFTYPPFLLVVIIIALFASISLYANRDKFMEYCGDKWMKFIDGRFHVRPEGSYRWILFSDWISALLSSTTISTSAQVPQAYCSNCGAEIKQNSLYCEDCGKLFPS